jgi:GT2 family glycosyltransferase
MRETSVSVVIPNWNGREHLDVCLRSLRDQTYKDFEVVVVDNGSRDGSVEFVEGNFPEVKVLKLRSNRGFSAAVNAGIKFCHGDYIALLNSDTEADPEWLRELVAAFEDEPDVGFCASKVLFYDRRHTVNSAGDAVSVTGYAWNIGRGHPDGEMFDVRRYVFGASAAASIYCRKMLTEIGLFDEDYFAYFEDVDISFRAQLRGYRCLYVPGAVVYHKEGGASRRCGDLTVFYIERNSILNLLKNVPLPIILGYSPTIVLGHTHRFFICLLKGRLPVWISAKLSAFPYLLRAYKKRLKIQRERTVSIRTLSSIMDRRRALWH